MLSLAVERLSLLSLPVALHEAPLPLQTPSTSASQWTWRWATLGSEGLGNSCHQLLWEQVEGDGKEKTLQSSSVRMPPS